MRELYYISGSDGIVAMLERKGGNDSIYYVHTDHPGSYDVISNPDGSVSERFNFDPWGRRRNPANWTYNNVPDALFTSRGFTGHVRETQFLRSSEKRKLIVERIPAAKLVGKHFDRT